MRTWEDRDRKTFVPKVLLHSLTKYGELSRIDRIERPGPKMAGWANQAIENFIVPRPPRHFLYMRQREKQGWQSEKD